MEYGLKHNGVTGYPCCFILDGRLSIRGPEIERAGYYAFNRAISQETETKWQFLMENGEKRPPYDEDERRMMLSIALDLEFKSYHHTKTWLANVLRRFDWLRAIGVRPISSDGEIHPMWRDMGAYVRADMIEEPSAESERKVRNGWAPEDVIALA